MSLNKFICCPPESIPKMKERDTEYISLYQTSIMENFPVGHVALQLKSNIRKSGIQPSVTAWDFCSIAMAVAAVDEAVPRNLTVDGWTRVLDLEVHLCEPLIWESQRESIEKMLRFLTGDYWRISFQSGGEKPPKPKTKRKYQADCVALLSGGLDSLVGAIDLQKEGLSPLFVSKIVAGDKAFQSKIASSLRADNRHLQWSYKSNFPLSREGSTRGRSIIFFAYAAIAAASLADRTKVKIPLYVPENGFISLNVPLTPGRMGTLSTKTTHPIYMKALQDIWDAVGLQVELQAPLDYNLKTKGEIVAECADIDLLKTLAGESTSCGRFGVFNKTHCGRCVPCLVRRAAFLRAGIEDPTVESKSSGLKYHYLNLRSTSQEDTATDIRAVANALTRISEKSLDHFLGGSLSFARPVDRESYKDVVNRGLKELEELLKIHEIL